MVLGRSPAEGGWALFASRAPLSFTQSQLGRKWVSCPASLVFWTAKPPWVLLGKSPALLTPVLLCAIPPEQHPAQARPHLALHNAPWRFSTFYLKKTPKTKHPSSFACSFLCHCTKCSCHTHQLPFRFYPVLGSGFLE